VIELERISEAALRSMYGAEAVSAGGATCLRAPLAPASPMLNRVVGLGLERPATEADLAEVEKAMGAVDFYVAVSPSARPGDLDAMLEARGLEAGWGWMLFERPPTPAEPVETTLELVEVGPAEAEGWAGVVTAAYGLPDELLGWVSSVTRLPQWTCWLGLDGDEPAAAAALWVEGTSAYLGLAATLPDRRRVGGQRALLAARIERALELGCTTIVTETGERLPDRPSNSYRNILRAGFQERGIVGNRLRRNR
jgi:GNAT superfamily N-acetyltransferase